MGGIKAVIFDWSGTVVDFGSRAPLEAFIETFAARGVTLRDDEARGPMGLGKRHHIEALARLPRIVAAWRLVHGRGITAGDIDQLHGIFEDCITGAVLRRSSLVPGTAGVVDDLLRRGIRIGSTTGYPRSVLTPLARLAATEGFAPEVTVCSDDLAAGRPSPLMMYRCFVDLAVWPASAVVKVDDTAPGIAEAVAAGSWAVGVTLSGNGAGIDGDDLAGLDAAQVDRLRKRAAAPLREAGAHHVIDTVADLPGTIDTIAGRLADGHMPHNNREREP